MQTAVFDFADAMDSNRGRVGGWREADWLEHGGRVTDVRKPEMRCG